MPPTPGHLQFEFTHGSPSGTRSLDLDAPFRILVIGDFGARWHRVLNEPFADRQPYEVGMDNLDDVLGSYAANLTLPLAGEPSGNARILARTLDDFHPDTLLKKIPSLADLLAARKGLDSSTPHAAAERVQSLLGLSTTAIPGASGSTPDATAATHAGESAQDTLSRLLDRPPPVSNPSMPATGELTPQNIVQKILSTPGKPAPPPPVGLPGLISAAELELSARLRSLLHDPDLQALEATWRGLDFLLRRCPDEERVQYHVLDGSLEEIAADPEGLYRLLRDQTWGVIVGLFTFGETAADLETLSGLGAIARSLGTAFLGGAHPLLVGCDSFGAHADPDDWKMTPPATVQQAWAELRGSEVAPHIGLALPRFLLRQPYGKTGDAIERFAFEEMTDDSTHENFLWGNSAVLCTQLLAEGHAAREHIAAGNIAGLQPAHFLQHGGTALKPCAEAWLVDRAAGAISRKGMIPVQSFKGRDAVQISGLHAICHPDKPSRISG